MPLKESVLKEELQRRADLEDGPMEHGIPTRWWDSMRRRCLNDHVSDMVLKSEELGRNACLVGTCRSPVYLTFPEDQDGPLELAEGYVDKLMDRLFKCKDNNEFAIAQLSIKGNYVVGEVNALDSSGANMVSIGFMPSKSISIKWRGRKFQTKVRMADNNAFLLCDENDVLQVAFFPVGANRCPANGDLIDPTDPDDVD